MLLTNNNKPVIIGALALVPVLIMEGVGFSKFWAPANPFYNALATFMSDPRFSVLNLIFQILVLAGPFAALALGTLPILRVQLQKEDSTLVSIVHLRARLVNFAVVAIASVTLAVMIAYGIVENFSITPR